MPRKIQGPNLVPSDGNNITLHEPERARIDNLNLKILKDLVNNPEIKSAELARKHGKPLSTIQRRRGRLERTVLQKKYDIDLTRMHCRQSDLLISVGRGNSEETAKKLLELYPDDIIDISLRIGNPEINLMASVVYRSTEELYQIIEQIKSVPLIESVEWSELVRTVEDGKASSDGRGRLVDKIFDGQ